MDYPKQQHAGQVPYHQLMTEETKRNNLNNRNPPGRKFDRDFLSKRQQALTALCRLNERGESANGTKKMKAKQHSDTETSSSEDKLWSGASPLEKALISCCTTGDAESGTDAEAENDVEEDSWVTGALRETKVLEFVGLTAMYCQDLPSRSLALAILERTHQLDEMINENFEITRQALASQSLDLSTKMEEKEDKPSPSKKPRISEGDMTAAIIVNPRPPPAPRLMLFLGTKGLQILSRWVLEASEPVIRDVPGNGTKEVRSQIRPSPTGLLLLPLLEFLENIPFSKSAIVQSKINKVIKKLSKEVDSLVSQAQAEGRVRLEKWTHADTGGLPVVAVQAALNNIKLSWEKKAKEASKANDLAITIDPPLGRLNALLKDRLEDLKKLDSGETDMPTWLVDVEKEERKAPPPVPQSSNPLTHFKNTTAEDRARKERENERHHLMKKDLEKARQEKLQLLKKLRDMKKPADNVEYIRTSSRRAVKWLDGLPASSKQRKREVLERVFVFDKDHVKLVEFKNDDFSGECQEEQGET